MSMQGLWLFVLVVVPGAGGSLLRRHAARSATLSPECPELDDLHAICRRGRVQVLVNKSATNQRTLQFGNECTAQSRINCEGPLPQGKGQCNGDCGECPCTFNANEKVSAPYIKLLTEQLSPLCSASAPSSRLLSVGLGGGELVQELLHKCPHMKIEAVEYSGDVLAVARQFFGIAQSEKAYPGRLTLEEADAWDAVKRKKDSTYDAVVIDAFGEGGEVPTSCRSRKLAEKVRSILTPSGILLQHIWHVSKDRPKVAEEFRETVHLYTSVFHGALDVIPVPMPALERVNDVLKASKHKDHLHTAEELLKEVDTRVDEDKKNKAMLNDAMVPLKGMMSEDQKKLFEGLLTR